MNTRNKIVCLLLLVLTLIGLRTVYYFMKDNEDFKQYFPITPVDNVNKTTGQIVTNGVVTDSGFIPTMMGSTGSILKKIQAEFSGKTALGPCEDPLWCNIPMPKVSYYRFSPPTDEYRWRKAQIQAMNGEQVLLKKTIEYFPNYLDFPDGDSSFRKYNLPIDVFIDKKRDLSFLKRPFVPRESAVVPSRHVRRKLLKKYEEFGWEADGIGVIPHNYDYLTHERAPVVKLGYFAFAGGASHFEGHDIGEAALSLSEFLNHWKAIRDEIQTPWIAVHSANENWGLLSTYFPNRTENWGRCCDKHEPLLTEFLNHNKTLLFMIGQHSNFTHPKLVTFPRGIPLPMTHVNRLVWDTMRMLAKHQPKNQLVFTASSTWGPRPQISKCVSAKFSEKDFQGASYGDNHKGRYSQEQYYQRLGMSRMGLALPGLGADCFRLWEAMILGTVPIFEKGFGMDKTLYHLPVLLLEDFDLVTPELLRVAYVEALYRSEEFEYEKLTQSFWWSFIANVSSSKSVQTVFDRFPPSADESDFMRPWERFNCWETNSCGAGTKRIPKTSC